MRTHRSARPLPAVLLAAALLAGCSADDGLVARVAELEDSQDALRSTVTELTAPDPDADGRAVARAEVAALVDRVDELSAELDAAVAAGDDGSLLIDERLTTLELQAEARASTDEELLGVLTALQESLDALTDRVSSLEAQLDAHRGDPQAHGG